MSLRAYPGVGSEFFGYRIESLLGRGGMSVVYRAHDLALARKVALKLLAPELAQDEGFRSRFLRESRVAASLDHPNVIPIYEAGEADGLLCIAMRYVEGTDLRTLLRREGALDPDRALSYCGQVAAALDAAHAHGLVHRDVKASNVLVADTGHCYLADFGLTHDAADRSDLTQSGHFLGSADYAAPEQIEGKPVTGAGDIYSLGCLLYECLTGTVPFPKASELAVLWAHVNEPPPELDELPTLTPVVRKALAKVPGDRYPTCGALVEAARAALPRAEAEVQRSSRRMIALVTLVSILLVGGLAAGLTLAFTGGSRTPKPNLTVRKDTLVRIDPTTNRIAGVIDAGVPNSHSFLGPVDVAVGGNKTVWVYNWADQTVWAVDARTNTVKRIVAVGGFPPATGNAIAADDEGAWVLSSKEGSGVLTRTLPNIGFNRDLPLHAEALAVAFGANTVWVATRSPTANAVVRVSPTTNTVLGTTRLQGSEIRSIAVGGGGVWTLQTGRISRLDSKTGRVTGRVVIPGGQVAQIAADAAGVWATMRLPEGGHALVRVDPRTLRVTKTIPMPIALDSGSATHVAVGLGSVWWSGADSGTVWRLDPATGKILAAIVLTPPLTSLGDFEPVQVVAGADAVWVTVTLSN